jgi:exonuclease III
MPVNRNFLRFCSWNIEGLSRKVADSDFISTIRQFDFISLVETWLSQDNCDLNLDGFYSFSKCRKKTKNGCRNSGGITILVKSSIRKGVKFLDKESCEEFVWWKLDKDFFNLTQDIFICSVYIPPQNSPREHRLNINH